MDLGRVLLLNLAAYAALAVAAGAGITYLRNAGSWLPVQRLRVGRWTGGEVIACIAVAQFVPEILVLVLDETEFFFQIFGQHVQHLRQMFVLSPLTLVLQFAIYFWLLYRTRRTYPAHVALTAARWRANVRLGLAAYCMATPVVLGLYFLVLLRVDQTPHPFEAIARQGLFTFEWFFFGFQVMVAAPLIEEWLFRGLLQGWLRRASPLGHFVVAACALIVGGLPWYESLKQRDAHPALVHGLEAGAPLALAAIDPQAPPILWDSLCFEIVIVGVYVAGVLKIWLPVFRSGVRHFVEQPVAAHVDAPPQLEGETPVLLPGGPRWEEFKIANARWAILGSATFFALSHASWPNAVPLLPLGLILGWLVFRTQSLVPAIVVHALFNAVAFIVLLVSTVYLN